MLAHNVCTENGRNRAKGGGRSGRERPDPICPTGWRCDKCQKEDSERDHQPMSLLMADVNNLIAEIGNAAEVNGIKDEHWLGFPDLDDEDEGSVVEDNEDSISDDEPVENSSSQDAGRQPRLPSKKALDGLRARLRHIIHNFELLRAHKIRAVKLKELRKDQLSNLDEYTVLEWKDYMGKLEARKSNQGTSENLGRKISLHGSLFVMRNPPQHIRDAYDYIDFSEFPDAEDDCLIQVNMYGASDESKQSPYHMGSVMSVQYKALQESYPWLTDAIPYSDQCGDYRSTAATVFNHEMGRLTGLRVRLVLHSEVGEGKGEVDMKFGHKAQHFVSILGRLPQLCAADLFQHLELCRFNGDYNLELDISMALFKPGSSGALPFLEQCASVEDLPEGGLILREIYGYSPGIKADKPTPEALDHNGIMQADETGSSALQTSGGPKVPQRQENDRAMGQIAAEMSRNECVYSSVNKGYGTCRKGSNGEGIASCC